MTAVIDPIGVPDAHNIVGLAFRPCHGHADLASMVAVREVCGRYDQVDPLSAVESAATLEDLERAMAPSDGFDPATQVFMVTSGSRIIDYGATKWWTETDGTWLFCRRGGWCRNGAGAASGPCGSIGTKP